MPFTLYTACLLAAAFLQTNAVTPKDVLHSNLLQRDSSSFDMDFSPRSFESTCSWDSDCKASVANGFASCETGGVCSFRCKEGYRPQGNNYCVKDTTCGGVWCPAVAGGFSECRQTSEGKQCVALCYDGEVAANGVCSNAKSQFKNQSPRWKKSKHGETCKHKSECDTATKNGKASCHESKCTFTCDQGYRPINGKKCAKETTCGGSTCPTVHGGYNLCHLNASKSSKECHPSCYNGETVYTKDGSLHCKSSGTSADNCGGKSCSAPYNGIGWATCSSGHCGIECPSGYKSTEKSGKKYCKRS